jgi:hypothetical protein
LRPHPARSGLELPATPLPAAERLARLYVAMLVFYAVQLLLLRHWVMALATLVLVMVTVLAMRRMAPRDPGAPRRLILSSDGSMHIATVGGDIQRVALAGESLWLGSAVLLVLRAPGRKHRLLLGRGNLDPPQLAGLRRRLRGAAIASGDPAVDSIAVSGQGASVVELFTTGITIRGP